MSTEFTANCTEGSVRLINASTTQGGLLEVCFDGTLGSVCPFGPREAAVVCRQLGLPVSGTCIMQWVYFTIL